MAVTNFDQVLATIPVTRLIHFTPATNLLGIFTDGAIRDTDDLSANSADSFDQTDTRRYDENSGHVCCSFEYPNAYYRETASKKTDFVNYPDWVCFILDINLVRRPGTLFSPCNAANGRGAWTAEGATAMQDCWATPSRGRGFQRRRAHQPAVPTDLQAEVQIPGTIALTDASAVVASSEGQAQSLFGFLHTYNRRPERLEWRYAPMFFEPVPLRDAIWNGRPVPEFVWTPSPEDLA